MENEATPQGCHQRRNIQAQVLLAMTAEMMAMMTRVATASISKAMDTWHPTENYTAIQVVGVGAAEDRPEVIRRAAAAAAMAPRSR
eukprot:6535783-Pyramimonas_sp.AAC.1